MLPKMNLWYTLAMEKITKNKILDAAAALVEQGDMRQVTLTQVGDQLGISHAALYKHFKNKRDLWTSLSLRWLDQILVALFPFDTAGYTSKLTIAHDWLWTLVEGKLQANVRDPKMFKLYTTYIDDNPEVLAIHQNDLKQSLMRALSTDNETAVSALLTAFTVFSAPAFSASWGDHTQAEFEAVWRLIAPGLQRALD